jgi:prephenate dehydratase
MTKTTIAFLGAKGSYSHQAASILRPGSTALGFDSFDDVIDAVARGNADEGVLPFENSTSGTIPTVLPLLAASELQINSEFFLTVNHGLFAHTTIELANITTVYSHPQGFIQSSDFLRKHLPGVQQKIMTDTASGIRDAVAEARPTTAAIGSEFAAQIYGATALARNISNDQDNTTRFLMVSRAPHPVDGEALSSLIIQVSHKASALARALETIGREKINLVKLDSFKAPSFGPEPTFYLELGCAHDDARFVSALRQISEFVSYSKFLGSYPADPARNNIRGFLSVE